MQLIDEVRILIQTYLDASRSRSIGTLAKKSGVSYSTVRRVVTGETTQAVIDTTVIPILSVFMKRKEIHELIGKYDPKFAQVWKPIFDDDCENTTLKMATWKDFDQHIIALASTSKGVSSERLAKDLGELAGLARAEELVNMGILKEEYGIFYTPSENFTDITPSSVLERITIFSRSYNLNNVGRGAYYWIFSESMCEEAYKEIQNASLEFITRVNEVKAKYKSKKPTRVGQFSLLGNFIDLDEGKK